jgi:hypothetical protein
MICVNGKHQAGGCELGLKDGLAQINNVKDRDRERERERQRERTTSDKR